MGFFWEPTPRRKEERTVYGHLPVTMHCFALGTHARLYTRPQAHRNTWKLIYTTPQVNSMPPTTRSSGLPVSKRKQPTSGGCVLPPERRQFYANTFIEKGRTLKYAQTIVDDARKQTPPENFSISSLYAWSGQVTRQEPFRPRGQPPAISEEMLDACFEEANRRAQKANTQAQHGANALSTKELRVLLHTAHRNTLRARKPVPPLWWQSTLCERSLLNYTKKLAKRGVTCVRCNSRTADRAKQELQPRNFVSYVCSFRAFACNPVSTLRLSPHLFAMMDMLAVAVEQHLELFGYVVSRWNNNTRVVEQQQTLFFKLMFCQFMDGWCAEPVFLITDRSVPPESIIKIRQKGPTETQTLDHQPARWRPCDLFIGNT